MSQINYLRAAECRWSSEEQRANRLAKEGFVVSGCAETTSSIRGNGCMYRFDGTYWPDADGETRQYPGFSRPYRQQGSECTIEYSHEYRRWFISEGYGLDGYYFRCDSTSLTPPRAGWYATIHGAGPAPRVEPASKTADGSVSPACMAQQKAAADTSPVSVMSVPSAKPKPAPLARRRSRKNALKAL